MDDGEGLEGSKWGGGLFGPWLVLLWRLEDWLPMWHPTFSWGWPPYNWPGGRLSLSPGKISVASSPQYDPSDL